MRYTSSPDCAIAGKSSSSLELVNWNCAPVCATRTRPFRNVLLVPNVDNFNDAQSKPVPAQKGSGDFTYAELHLAADLYADILQPGIPFDATWFIRSPGVLPGPLPAGINNRLCKFEISVSYSLTGSWVEDATHLGGANGKFKGNRHIVVPDKQPTANLLLAMADLAGSAVGQIGHSTGRLSLT